MSCFVLHNPSHEGQPSQEVKQLQKHVTKEISYISFFFCVSLWSLRDQCKVIRGKTILGSCDNVVICGSSTLQKWEMWAVLLAGHGQGDWCTFHLLAQWDGQKEGKKWSWMEEWNKWSCWRDPPHCLKKKCPYVSSTTFTPVTKCDNLPSVSIKSSIKENYRKIKNVFGNTSIHELVIKYVYESNLEITN